MPWRHSRYTIPALLRFAVIRNKSILLISLMVASVTLVQLYDCPSGRVEQLLFEFIKNCMIGLVSFDDHGAVVWTVWLPRFQWIILGKMSKIDWWKSQQNKTERKQCAYRLRCTACRLIFDVYCDIQRWCDSCDHVDSMSDVAMNWDLFTNP